MMLVCVSSTVKSWASAMPVSLRHMTSLEMCTPLECGLRDAHAATRVIIPLVAHRNEWFGADWGFCCRKDGL